MKREEVDKIQSLLKMEISEDLESKFLHQVISWFKKLEEVDTDGIKPLYNTNISSISIKKDRINNSVLEYDDRRIRFDGYFQVPKIIKTDAA